MEGAAMSRFIVAAIASLIVAAFAAGPAAAANPHPGGTGQPGKECGDEGATSEPAGFTNSTGFENAEDHYAGSDGTPSLANGNPLHAVSQYDVACFQFTAAHGG
jgi:hypothetical protein